MFTAGSVALPHYYRIGRSGLDRVAGLELEQEARFLEPLPEILAFVRQGPAHSLIGIEAAGALVGFYVVHPDRRDRSCWWLGWLAIDRRWQGCGYGRLAMMSALARLRNVAKCRRVRLLVAAENTGALRLYTRAGFAQIGVWAPTGELVMEVVLAPPLRLAPIDCVLNAYSLVQAMWLRLWRRGVPPAARMSGEFHGPPGWNLLGAPCPPMSHALHAAA